MISKTDKFLLNLSVFRGQFEYILSHRQFLSVSIRDLSGLSKSHRQFLTLRLNDILNLSLNGLLYGQI